MSGGRGGCVRVVHVDIPLCVCVCVCMRACVRARARARVCVCVCVCVRGITPACALKRDCDSYRDPRARRHAPPLPVSPASAANSRRCRAPSPAPYPWAARCLRPPGVCCPSGRRARCPAEAPAGRGSRQPT